MKIERILLLAAFLIGTAGPTLAGNSAEPGKGPPDCPGTPGAFISSEARNLNAADTPPGQIVKELAKSEKGVGDEVRDALTEDCGIGALPPPSD